MLSFFGVIVLIVVGANKIDLEHEYHRGHFDFVSFETRGQSLMADLKAVNFFI
jgi:hypothetical protein